MTAQEERAYRALEGMLGDLPEPELPDGFSERFWKRFERVESGAEVLEPMPGEGLGLDGGAAGVPRAGRVEPAGHWIAPWLLAAASLLMLFGVGLWLSNRVGAQARPVAVLAAAEHPVEVTSSPGKPPEQTDQTLALAPGAVLTTSHGNAGVLSLGDQGENQVRVGANTVLRVRSLGRALRDSGELTGEFELDRGKVWVTERDARLAVRTSHVLLIPVGTEYEAITSGDSTQVVVWQGQVIARALDGSASRRIDEGEQVKLGSGVPLSQARVTPIDAQREKSSWYRWNLAVPLGTRPRLQARLLPPRLSRRLRQPPGVRRALELRQWLMQRSLRSSGRRPRGGSLRRVTPVQRRQSLRPRLQQNPGLRRRLRPRLQQNPGLRRRLRPRLQQNPGLRRRLRPRVQQSPGSRRRLRPRLQQNPGLRRRLRPRLQQSRRLRQRLQQSPGLRQRLRQRWQPGQGASRGPGPAGISAPVERRRWLRQRPGRGRGASYQGRWRFRRGSWQTRFRPGGGRRRPYPGNGP